MKRVVIVLSGCGVYDGSEVHEAVISGLVVERRGGSVIYVAPDMGQGVVVNHLNGEEERGMRGVMEEGARIARGKVRNMEEVQRDEYDGVIFPGGYGVVRTFSDYGREGEGYEVNGVVRQFIEKTFGWGKPMGFMCIAPLLAAGVLGRYSPRLTIGKDAEVAQAMELKGAVHIECGVEEVVKDDRLRIVSTPAYMLAKGMVEVESGVEKLVEALMGYMR